MANEGSTKPTYEELERYRQAFIDEVDRHTATLAALNAYAKEHSQLKAELLRVRGLLQRATESFEEIAGCNGNTALSMPCDDCRAVANEWLVEAQGAESADIGKLDSADESGVESKSVHLFGHDVPLPPGIEKLVADSIDAMTEEQLAKFRKDSAAIMEKSRGSAETGGEKAAPPNDFTYEQLSARYQQVIRENVELLRYKEAAQHVDAIQARTIRELREALLLPNFPRSSQNQTVASGVEGAHEGTTADKPGLAESSLSSPPPLCRNLFEKYKESYSCDLPLGHAGQHREQHTRGAVHWDSEPTIRQSSSLSESGPESAHSGKLNAADKSATQLPKDDL